MSQPAAFTRQFSFTNFQATNPTTQPPGSALDIEFNAVKTTTDQIRANLALIQRDDGAIANSSVGLAQLKSEVTVGFNAPTVWTTATAFSLASTVFQGSGFYRCLVAHTSGAFATDLAAAKWQLIVNMAAVPLVSASQIAVTPSGMLTTDVQGSLAALDAGKAATSHTHPSSAISDSTAAGRAMIVAPNAAAQTALLGIGALGAASGDIKMTAAYTLPTGWYWCDGSAKSRTGDAALFAATTITQNGTLTSGGFAITGLADTSNLSPGMPLSGTGITGGTVVRNIDSSTQITISIAASVNATTPIVFAPWGVGDGSATFNLPLMSGYTPVGRDNMGGSAAATSQVVLPINTTSASTTATVSATGNLCVGMYVSSINVLSGTIITSVDSGTAITLSAAATASAGPTACRFSALRDAQTLGAGGGERVHGLNVAELPQHAHRVYIRDPTHTHDVPVDNTGSTGGNGKIALQANNTGAVVRTSVASITGVRANSVDGGGSGTDDATAITGSTVSHNNYQPSKVVNFIIKQ